MGFGVLWPAVPRDNLFPRRKTYTRRPLVRESKNHGFNCTPHTGPWESKNLVHDTGRVTFIVWSGFEWRPVLVIDFRPYWTRPSWKLFVYNVYQAFASVATVTENRRSWTSYERKNAKCKKRVVFIKAECFRLLGLQNL